MASINGVEIKNLKEFKGHEGEDLLQGTVYYKGAKLGFWSQDSWGGEDHYDFDTSKLDVAVERVKSTKVGIESKYYDIDSLMIELAMLKQKENLYKKGVQKGYSVLLVIIPYSKDREEELLTFASVNFKSAKEVTQDVKERYAIAYFSRNGFFNFTPHFQVYTKLSDFDKEIGKVDTPKKDKVVKKDKPQYVTMDELRKQIAGEDKTNGRFTYTSSKNGDPVKIITDNVTGKSIEVPLFAWSEVAEALEKLFN